MYPWRSGIRQMHGNEAVLTWYSNPGGKLFTWLRIHMLCSHCSMFCIPAGVSLTNLCLWLRMEICWEPLLFFFSFSKMKWKFIKLWLHESLASQMRKLNLPIKWVLPTALICSQLTSALPLNTSWWLPCEPGAALNPASGWRVVGRLCWDTERTTAR